MRKILLSTLVVLMISMFSCQKDREQIAPQENEFEMVGYDASSNTVPGACGESEPRGALLNGKNTGVVLVYNDPTLFYIHQATTADYRLRRMWAYAGDCDKLPTNPDGTPKFEDFPYFADLFPAVRKNVFQIPTNDIPACGCYIIRSEILSKDAAGKFTISNIVWSKGPTYNDLLKAWASPLPFCKGVCEVEEPCEIGHRTQTQGGWGTTARGNNPGKYRDNNFAGAFPGGLIVGDACGFKITLTSSAAVEAFLPQGGTPAALTQNYTNPTTAITVLAGQVTALALSVGFDNYDPNFSPSPTPLKNLVVGSGIFAGKTVGEILALGHKALAGCAVAYTLSEINDVISSINENFVDGTTNNGFLTCPK